MSSLTSPMIVWNRFCSDSGVSLSSLIGPVDLVDEQDRLDLLPQRLSQDRLGLGHHALDRADHDDRAVDRAHGARDVAAEVDVAGGVDEVDEVLLSLELVDDRDVRVVDREQARLLLLVEVELELLARQLVGDHARPPRAGCR